MLHSVRQLAMVILVCCWAGSAVSSARAQEAPAHAPEAAHAPETLHGEAHALTEGAAEHATEETPRDYNQPPIPPNVPLSEIGTMFLFTLTLFGVFFLVMKAAVWQPLIAGLDSREARIVRAEENARLAKLEVEKLAAQAEKRMAEAQTQVAGILTQARAEAEATKMRIVTQAEQDAQRIKREALDAIAAARDAALRELENQVEQQVSLATEHVAGRRM